ncbi:hypothetical protein IGI37_000015 [Enterococcus sp. AZ194]|uniref:HAD-IIB family hydrolase n=1 Tax=Enterococcus sp. AZ194 TaxID=2774629 RepID=UPI003F27A998
MKRYRAIIFYYDGTIKFENEQRISPEIEALLTHLRKNNVLVILATGRPHNHCHYLLDEQLVDCIVSANGSLVQNAFGSMHSTALAEQTIEAFTLFCTENQLPGTIYTDELYSNGFYNKDLERGLKQSMNLTPGSLKTFNSPLKSEIYLLCDFCPDTVDTKLKESFPNQFLSRWHPTIISILDKEVTKVTGILKALEYYQIAPHECVAIGDGSNDIDMLKSSGYGIAVGSENSKLVAASDKVITKVDKTLLHLFNN